MLPVAAASRLMCDFKYSREKKAFQLPGKHEGTKGLGLSHVQKVFVDNLDNHEWMQTIEVCVSDTVCSSETNG